jgi:tRNA G18 (ribose-2'-O)-methylase SpoU
MGASLKVTTTTIQDPISWIEQLRDLRIESVVTSLQHPSVPLEQFRSAGKMMVIVGNEAQGVPEAIQSMADHRVRIPMELEVDSFNVAVATGIVLHALRRLLPRAT